MAGGKGILVKVVQHLFRQVAGDVAKVAAKDAAKTTAKNAAKDAAKTTARTGLRDLAGRAKQFAKRVLTKDPIDVATGEVVLHHTDLSLPGILPLVLERTHLSSYRAGRLFGTSWASTLDQHLEVDSQGVCFATADGDILCYPHPEPGIPAYAFDRPDRPLERTAVGGYTLTDPQTGRMLHFPPSFGGVHELAAITDRNGHRIDIERDEAGIPVLVRHSGGRRVAVDSADGRITGLRLLSDGPDLTLVGYGYDEAGNLARVVNSSGLPLQLTYDDQSRLTGWQDRNGFWYRYGYDEQGRGIWGRGTDGYLNAMLTYLPGATILTDSLGHSTTYEFNDLGQVIAETDPLGHTTRQTWDPKDRLLSRTDPLGRTTRFGYDDSGNLTSVLRPDGTGISAAYNAMHQPVLVTEPDGAVWRQEYDERGNLLAATDPAGATTRYRYDPRGGLTGVTDALGATTRAWTDPAGLPTEISDPLGSVTRYTRDGLGQVTETVDPVGGVTRLGWTAEGEIAWITAPSGGEERWSYDPEGNLTEHTDAAGRRTRAEAGPFDVTTAQIGPDGVRLEFGYDTELRLTSVTNPLGLVWRYEYDPAGRLIREIDFDGRTLGYAYDAAGQLTSRTNGLGQVTHYSRDLLGNTVERRSDDGAAHFCYDAAGRIVRAVNAVADVRYDHDRLGRVIAETCNGRTVAGQYDAAGRRIRRVTPSGVESLWEYDLAGQPISLRIGEQRLRFGYDAAGREIRRELPGGGSLEQFWDAEHRLTAQTIWARSSATPMDGLLGTRVREVLQRRDYGYRPDGNVSAVGDRIAGDRRYDLDVTGRVIAVQARGWTERYAYDPAGNLAQAEWPSAASPDAADAQGERLLTGMLARRGGRTAYEYDAQGRLILKRRHTLSGQRREWRYGWDAEDRLTHVTTPDGQMWRYRYDALGRRIAKQRLGPDGSQVVEQVDFSWDGTNLVEELTVGRVTVWEYEMNTFRPVAQAVHISAQDAPQQWVDQQFYSIVADLVGTPAELITVSGEIAWHAGTSLWGSPLPGAPDGAFCPLRFPGQYYDAETGCHYNYQRHYDPSQGRYLSADPIGLEGGANPFGYAPNPLVWLDPLGLKCSYAEMKKMIASQAKSPPDVLQKGVHFNVGTIELAIKPTHDGGVILKPVFARDAGSRGLDAAIKKGYGALEYPEFRKFLTEAAQSGMQLASQSKIPTFHGRGFEFSRLIKALGRMG